MTLDTLVKAQALQRRIDSLKIFLKGIEISVNNPWTPSGCSSSVYSTHFGLTPPYQKGDNSSTLPEYVALHDEIGPLIVARLKVILAKWEAELVAL